MLICEEKISPHFLQVFKGDCDDGDGDGGGDDGDDARGGRCAGAGGGGGGTRGEGLRWLEGRWTDVEVVEICELPGAVCLTLSCRFLFREALEEGGGGGRGGGGGGGGGG